MKRLSRLINLNDYLRDLRPPLGAEACVVHVVDQENAAAALSRAAGDQIVVAVPECVEQGRSSDSFSSTVSAAFFVLAKVNGPSRTQATTDEAYGRLLALAQEMLSVIERDLTSGGCRLISGLVLSEVRTVPQYSIFGGWSGWSVEMTFE